MPINIREILGSGPLPEPFQSERAFLCHVAELIAQLKPLHDRIEATDKDRQTVLAVADILGGLQDRQLAVFQRRIAERLDELESK